MSNFTFAPLAIPGPVLVRPRRFDDRGYIMETYSREPFDRDRAEFHSGQPNALVAGARASRPANSVLDSARFAATFGYRAKPWQERMREVVGSLTAQRVS
ncbi:hypothetical protein AB4Z40_06440 [Bosea sp. 2YAB26]|uniref:hypothetical protein n=1 Tax=Bosea sp. 2YAB26 TaxID=3237478 RepID=UPI003F917CFC